MYCTVLLILKFHMNEDDKFRILLTPAVFSGPAGRLWERGQRLHAEGIHHGGPPGRVEEVIGRISHFHKVCFALILNSAQNMSSCPKWLREYTLTILVGNKVWLI